MEKFLPHDMGFDLVRVTEGAALQAGRWKGRGEKDEADRAATRAVFNGLKNIDINGRLVLSECPPELEERMVCGSTVGNGKGPDVDVVSDPVDGREQLALGQPGALSVIAVAPAGSIWSPTKAIYMEKIVVNSKAAAALVPECMDAPAAWTLALIGRAKGKPVGDLTVFILDRPRHSDLIAEVRNSGARVMLRPDGDIAGALMACVPESRVDVLMGIGGVLEGAIVACAVKSLGGGMLGRLAPQSKEEDEGCRLGGYDMDQILTCDELVKSDDVYVAVTGVTTGPLLTGVEYHGERASSNSLILRGRTKTRRDMHAQHLLEPAE